jgi:hypothetical protein
MKLGGSVDPPIIYFDSQRSLRCISAIEICPSHTSELLSIISVGHLIDHSVDASFHSKKIKIIIISVKNLTGPELDASFQL